MVVKSFFQLEKSIIFTMRKSKFFMVLVCIVVGCKVPADMRMVEILSNQLRVDQAILTGNALSFHREFIILLHA